MRKKRSGILVIVDDGIVFVIVIVVITAATIEKKADEQEAREDNCIAARIHLANACTREIEKKRKRQSIEQSIYIYIFYGTGIQC